MSVMAGGVALYAMNLYFTAALMPSVAGELGGQSYYAWAATAFLMTAVIATMFVSQALGKWGPRLSYVLAYLAFAVGTVVSASSPSMEIFVCGRAIQGIGAGLLTGLGYATIRSILPPELWTRGTGLVSAMFGVGTLLGPALGGLFADAGLWRVAFVTLASIAIALVLITIRALPQRRTGSPTTSRVPILPIGVLALSAATLSATSAVHGAWVPVAIVVGLALFFSFLWLDSRSDSGVLPRVTYQRGNDLKWVYLTVAAICAGVMTENFIPLFGQQLAHLTPLVSGLLGAALSAGWVISQLLSANAAATTARVFLRVGPVLLVIGLVCYGLLQSRDASALTAASWAVALFVAGIGVGLAFPHLSVAAMRSSDDANEGAKAAAAVSTTQLIAFTLASALGGAFLAAGGNSDVASAKWLIFGVTALASLGIFTALRIKGNPISAPQ